MIGWKCVWQMVGMAVLLVISGGCGSGEPETSQKGSQPGSAAADRVKIIGRGATRGELPPDQWAGPGDVPPSVLVEFARENPEHELADDYLLGAARRAIDSKQYEQAIDILDMTVEQHPHAARLDGWAHGVLDPSESFCSEFPLMREAALVQARHIDEHPNFSADEAIRYKALVLEELGKTTDALRLLQRYVEQHPRGRWAKEDAEVRPRLKQWNLSRRTDELIFLHLAWLYYDGGDHTRSGEILTRAIKTFPNSFCCRCYYGLLARVYQQTGNAAGEVDALTRVHELREPAIRAIHSMYWNPPGAPSGNLLRLNHPDRLRSRLRSPEKIHQRLRELGAPVQDEE